MGRVAVYKRWRVAYDLAKIMSYSGVGTWCLAKQSVLCGVGAFIIFLIVAIASPSKLYIEMSNDNGYAGEIYLNTGSGYKPGRSVGISLIPNGKTHTYTLDLRSAFPRSVRIDPGTSVGTISISKAEFRNALYSRKLSCDDFHMLHALSKTMNANSSCVLKATANDPYFEFDVFSKGSLGSFYINWSTLAQGLGYALLTSLLLTITQRARCSVTSASENWLTNARCINLYAILAFGFISFIFLNLHVSSLNEWSKNGFSSVGSRILFGDSRPIRSDEWLVATPFMASQTANQFATNNPSLGTASAPIALAATVPVQGVYGYSQPRFWGFYLLGFEKGLSWLSAFRVFGLLVTGFILFSIVTRGNFWLSLLGASWIALSPFTQWWFVTNLPDMMIGFAGGVSSLYILINSTKKKIILLAAIGLFFSGITFVSALYPAFLVPLFYLALFLIGGLVLRDSLVKKFLIEWQSKLSGLVVAVCLVLCIFVLWLIQASDAISLIQQSVYPGRRIALGGGWDLARIFTGLFSPLLGWNLARIFNGEFNPLLSADKFPISMGNVCEASSYILLFPIAWWVMAGNYWRRREINPLNLALSIYIVLLLVWMTIGYPEWLAIATKMSMSPTKRTLIGLGLASILLVLSVFSEIERKQNDRPMRSSVSTLVLLATVFAGVFYWLNIAYPDYLLWWESVLLVLAFTLWGAAFIEGKKLALVALTILLSANGLFVNPLVHGVTSLQDSQLAAVLQEEKDNGAKQWLALPNCFIPQYLKANGAAVWNGVRFTSAPKEMRLIDPDEKYRYVWYRYAHFAVESLPFNSPSEFILKRTDAVLLKVDICSESISAMGINRFAFMTKPDLKEAPCLAPVRPGPIAGIWLYKSVDIK